MFRLPIDFENIFKFKRKQVVGGGVSVLRVLLDDLELLRLLVEDLDVAVQLGVMSINGVDA